jgi:hypothetical protein
MISAEGHRGQPLICLLIRLRSSNERSALPHGAISSALPIEPTRALINANSNPAAPRIISTRTWEKRPAPADGNSPLRQVLAAPGGDARPLACSEPANLKVLAGFLAGEVRGGGPIAGTRSRESQGCIVCRELGATMAISPPEPVHCPRHLSPGRPESHSRLSSPFPEFLPLASSRSGPAGSRTARPAAVIRSTPASRSAGSGRCGMIDTAESAAARPDQISCATRGDEVINCQIFHPLSH